MSTDPDLTAAIETLNKNMGHWFGTNNSFLGARAARTADGSQTASALSSSFRSLNDQVKLTSKSVQMLHSTFDEATSHFKNSLVRLGEIGAIAALAIGAIMDMTKTYSRLTDVGQFFGGSMMEMSKLAGRAGLSLHDFANSLTKHSMAISALGLGRGASGIDTWIYFQNGMREALKSVGQFGMSMSELTDVGLDYIEILRTTGRLQGMSTGRLINESIKFAESVTQLAAATGASRQQIVKDVVAGGKDPVRLMLDFSETQNRNIDRLIAYFSAVKQAGGTDGGIVNIIQDMMGMIKANQNPLVSPLARELMSKPGGVQIAQELAKIAEAQMRGEVSPEQIAKQMYGFEQFMKRMFLTPNSPMGALMSQSPELKRLYSEMASGIALLGTPEQQAARALQTSLDELRKTMDPLTKAMLDLPSQFEKLTGSFREGFFTGLMKSGIMSIEAEPTKKEGETAEAFAKRIAEWEKRTGFKHIEPKVKMVGGVAARDKQGKLILENQAEIDAEKARRQKAVDEQAAQVAKLNEDMKKLGLSVGTFLSDIFTVDNVNKFQKGFWYVIGIFEEIGNKLSQLKKVFTDLGANDTWATILTAAVVGLGYKIITTGLKEFFSLTVRSQAVYVNGGPIGGGPGAVAGGVGGAGPRVGPDGKPLSRFQDTKARVSAAMGRSGLFSMLGITLLGIFTSVFASNAFAAVEKDIPNFPYKDKIMEYGVPIAGLLASMFLPQLLTGIASYLLAGMAVAITPAAVIAAIAAAVVGGGYLAFLQGKKEGKAVETINRAGFDSKDFTPVIASTEGADVVSGYRHNKTGKFISVDEATDVAKVIAATMADLPARPETPEEHDLKVRLDTTTQQIRDLSIQGATASVSHTLSQQEMNEWLKKLTDLQTQQKAISEALLAMTKKNDEREEKKIWDAAKSKIPT